MDEKQREQLMAIFALYPEIKLVYFFGSRATGESGPMSDYDFAFYLDERDIKKIYDIKFELQDKISSIFKTDNVDIVMLNTTEGSELKFNIIKDGELIYCIEPFKVLIEPKILNEYFDFHEMLLRNGLTKN